jgi:hypothetical protein
MKLGLNMLLHLSTSKYPDISKTNMMAVQTSEVEATLVLEI